MLCIVLKKCNIPYIYIIQLVKRGVGHNFCDIQDYSEYSIKNANLDAFTNVKIKESKICTIIQPLWLVNHHVLGKNVVFVVYIQDNYVFVRTFPNGGGKLLPTLS